MTRTKQNRLPDLTRFQLLLDEDELELFVALTLMDDTPSVEKVKQMREAGESVVGVDEVADLAENTAQ